MSTCTEAHFLKDTAEHVMEVLRDDGLYRHIRFRKPGTMSMHFDLVTWPGHLAYSGDMGCYVFTRLADMFEFFRTDRRHKDVEGLAINPSYWSEKLVAVSGSRESGSAKEFDEDKFKRTINELRVGWIREAAREHTLDKEERRELWEAVDMDVLSNLYDGGDSAIRAAYEFSWTGSWTTARWDFTDCVIEGNFTSYTFCFIWCCYALAWGIKTYDEAKEKAHA